MSTGRIWALDSDSWLNRNRQTKSQICFSSMSSKFACAEFVVDPFGQWLMVKTKTKRKEETLKQRELRGRVDWVHYAFHGHWLAAIDQYVRQTGVAQTSGRRRTWNCCARKGDTSVGERGQAWSIGLEERFDWRWQRQKRLLTSCPLAVFP